MSETLSNIVRTNDRVASTAALHVEVIADFVCPFCFLGKRRLDQALTAVKGPSDTSWYPFEEYLTKRFGSPANVEPILEHIASDGRSEGIDFRFDRIRHVPNTLAVHQLMQLAETIGIDQTELAEDLMSAFFEHGRNIGDRDELIEIARPHGITSDETVKAITNEQLRQVVLTREGQVRASGLSSAPGFLLNRRLLVVGAQSTENIVNAFDRAMFGEGTDALESPALH